MKFYDKNRLEHRTIIDALITNVKYAVFEKKYIGSNDIIKGEFEDIEISDEDSDDFDETSTGVHLYRCACGDMQSDKLEPQVKCTICDSAIVIQEY